jgi:hypothetical protein
MEIGTTLRNALYVQPVAGATVVVEFRQVPLGRELVGGGGLHHVWLRKYGDGTVKLRVLVDGKEIGRTEAGNRSGWRVDRFDTGPSRRSRPPCASRSPRTSPTRATSASPRRRAVSDCRRDRHSRRVWA